MKFEIINNNGPNNLRDILEEIIPQAKSINIAVAFISEKGLDKIIGVLNKAANKGVEIRILTGLYQKITEPRALKQLLAIQKNKKNIVVKLSCERKFHRKFYCINLSKKTHLIIGSSNLTDDGLSSAGELNAYLSLPRNSDVLEMIIKDFENEWGNRNAVTLNEKQIRKYEDKRDVVYSNFNSATLKDILGSETSHRGVKNNVAPALRKYHTFDLHGYLDEKTADTIGDETNWDKKKYECCNCSRDELKLQAGDRIMVFDHWDKKIFIAEIKDSVKTSIWTKYGRYFIAYRHLKGFRRKRMSDDLWKELKKLGVIKKHKRKKPKKTISDETWKQVEEIFKKKKL
ncbi:MAG: hypothetical protein Kow0090_13470 [Myxococcota bacterium]